jgi:hypothetical protein
VHGQRYLCSCSSTSRGRHARQHSLVFPYTHFWIWRVVSACLPFGLKHVMVGLPEHMLWRTTGNMLLRLLTTFQLRRGSSLYRGLQRYFPIFPSTTKPTYSPPSFCSAICWPDEQERLEVGVWAVLKGCLFRVWDKQKHHWLLKG